MGKPWGITEQRSALTQVLKESQCLLSGEKVGLGVRVGAGRPVVRLLQLSGTGDSDSLKRWAETGRGDKWWILEILMIAVFADGFGCESKKGGMFDLNPVIKENSIQVNLKT